MERKLSVASLSPVDVDPAFALIRALHSDLTLDHWRSFATHSNERVWPRHSGMVGIRNERGYLCGLFVYHVEPSLKFGRAFVVDVLAALDIIDVEPVMRMILATTRSTASQLQCGITQIRLSKQQAALAHYLTSGGFQSDGEVLSASVSR